MKKYILIFFLAFFALTHTQAQTQDSTKTKIYRNHIGLNTQFAQDQFFNPNARTPLQLMYKRQNKKNTGAWRVGVGFIQNIADSTLPVKPWSYMIYDVKANFSLGYEWQRKINNKLLIYYGVEAAVAVAYQKRAGTRIGWIVNNLPTYESGFTERTDVRYSIGTFLGLRYQFHNRWYLAYEMQLQGFANDYKYIHRFTFPNGKATRDDALLHTGLSFQPYSALYLNYQF